MEDPIHPPPAGPLPLEQMRAFYDGVYWKGVRPPAAPTGHLRRLARRLTIRADQQVLDVACGDGTWLLAVQDCGAIPAGVDLSENAVAACRLGLPDGEFHATAAESLPFADGRFDVVTCLGSLEHFVDPGQALREMRRVAKADARFVLLVPNAGFLTRRLGLFAGTWQVDAKEEVRSLEEWSRLFASAGLRVQSRWRDLHVLSTGWICSGRWFTWPFRAAQALALAVWPLSWQYQVYHLCEAEP